MTINHFASYSVRYIIAQTTALKKRGYYVAAKSLIRRSLEKHPHPGELHALCARIEQAQQAPRYSL